MHAILSVPSHLSHTYTGMAWLDIAISSLTIAYYGLQWAIFKSAFVIILLLQLVAWLFAALWKATLFTFAPVIYTIRWVSPEQGRLSTHFLHAKLL